MTWAERYVFLVCAKEANSRSAHGGILTWHKKDVCRAEMAFDSGK